MTEQDLEDIAKPIRREKRRRKLQEKLEARAHRAAHLEVALRKDLKDLGLTLAEYNGVDNQ